MNHEPSSQPPIPPVSSPEVEDVEMVDLDEMQNSAEREKAAMFEAMVKQSANFQELKRVIQGMQVIPIRKGEYFLTAEKVNEILDNWRRGKAEDKEIPSAFGIRDKAFDLITDDVVYASYAASERGIDIPLPVDEENKQPKEDNTPRE